MQSERANEDILELGTERDTGTNEACQGWDVGRDELVPLVRAGGDEAVRTCWTGQTLWVGCGSAHGAFGVLPGGEGWECAWDAIRTRPG